MKMIMPWQEWATQDAVGLAEWIRKGEISAAEIAAQAAQATAKVNPRISSVVELFDDAMANPATDGTRLDGPFAGVPILIKDLGPRDGARSRARNLCKVIAPRRMPF